MMLSEGMPTAVFGWMDWAIIAAYLAFTTMLGARLSGKQSTIRDFFLGGRKLPWWAISGSIIATEISAATFIAVPAMSFAAGGNMTYLQLGLGAIIARIVIGLVFVPRYYAEEIYSPYDYMGSRLGRVKSMTTLIFFVGGVLGQGARVYVAAFILRSVAGIDLITSIWVIGIVAIGWTLLGGITTVIWTDLIQFGVLVIGAASALVFCVSAVEGGVGEVTRIASEADKFRMIDARSDAALGMTIWTGLFAMPFLNLAALGIDQVMAQRMFCCKTRSQATLAIIVSCIGQFIAVLMLLVGIALYAYYQHHPLPAGIAAMVGKDTTSILPHFIATKMPLGVRAVIVAAILAAAISSLDSALAALSQTTVSAFKARTIAFARRVGLIRGRAPSDIGLSKALVVFWGVALCLMASACVPIRGQFDSAIELVLGLVAFTYGPLLGIFLLAFLPTNRDDHGLPWAVPMAILAVFGLVVHAAPWSLGGYEVAWSDLVVWAGCAAALVLAAVQFRDDLARIGCLTAVVLAVLALHHFSIGTTATGKPIYPHAFWGYPIGTFVTLLIGWGVGRPRRGNRAQV
ncbi:MAG: hypothetical protein IPK83_13080 [Planctomycetes bacterium]|nr:hypothetical protein [Planctomycetota bacterium]